MKPSHPLRRCVLGAVMTSGALAALVFLASPAAAVTNLKRQMDAPPITLKDVNGIEVSTAKMRDRIVIVVFGEVYHEKTRQACTQIDAVLRDTRFSDEPVTVMLIVSQELKADDLKPYAADKLPATILCDPGRKAFGAYEVAVMPSVVVIDKQGRVVHAVAGLMIRFSDILTDSLLLAAGKLSAERFDQSLHPPPATAPVTDAGARADRLAQLAKQLARRGLDELAAEKYAEAVKVDPDHVESHLQLGALLLKRRRLAEAEAHFRSVLARQPTSLEATLGLAFVQTLRGGAEVAEAERAVRGVLEKAPSQPRAHYLLGLILEQKGRMSEAAASFKKAAQLLLETREQE